jgi:hypothetical protein
MCRQRRGREVLVRFGHLASEMRGLSVGSWKAVEFVAGGPLLPTFFDPPTRSIISTAAVRETGLHFGIHHDGMWHGVGRNPLRRVKRASPCLLCSASASGNQMAKTSQSHLRASIRNESLDGITGVVADCWLVAWTARRPAPPRIQHRDQTRPDQPSEPHTPRGLSRF